MKAVQSLFVGVLMGIVLLTVIVLVLAPLLKWLVALAVLALIATLFFRR